MRIVKADFVGAAYPPGTEVSFPTQTGDTLHRTKIAAPACTGGNEAGNAVERSVRCFDGDRFYGSVLNVAH